MSEEKIKSEENVNEIGTAETADISIAVKRKRFKKSDILVLGVCLVASCLIWLYASNLQKTAEQKEISKDKEVIAGAIDDINKTTSAETGNN